MEIRPGDVLNGDFWPEPVRVLTVQNAGPRTKIEAVGLRTQQFFPRILTADDLNRVRVSADTGRDFTGRAEVFFLAVEGHTERRTLDNFYAIGLRTEPALLVRGSSRRITIMRFRPANIRVINRRDSRLDRDLYRLHREGGRKTGPENVT